MSLFRLKNMSFDIILITFFNSDKHNKLKWSVYLYLIQNVILSQKTVTVPRNQYTK